MPLKSSCSVPTVVEVTTTSEALAIHRPVAVAAVGAVAIQTSPSPSSVERVFSSKIEPFSRSAEAHLTLRFRASTLCAATIRLITTFIIKSTFQLKFVPNACSLWFTKRKANFRVIKIASVHIKCLCLNIISPSISRIKLGELSH